MSFLARHDLDEGTARNFEASWISRGDRGGRLQHVMSTTPQGPYPTAEDLETTADYPPLSPGAPVDTWVTPPRAGAVGAEDPLRAHLEEIKTLRQSVAAITVIRDQLQADLSALTAKRHELEELLLTRDALLSKHERDLSAGQDEIGQLRESVAALTISRDQLQAQWSALASKLQELEQSESAGQAQRSEHERELTARDQHLAEVTAELATRAQQHFLVAAERDDLQSRLQRAKADLSSMAQRRQPADADLARRNAAIARADDEMTQLQRRVAGHLEALQRAEARRQVFESMLRERENMLDERDARLRALQEELESQRREDGAALERANAPPDAPITRAGGPDRHFGQQIHADPVRNAPPGAVALAPANPEENAPLPASILDGQPAGMNEAVRELQALLKDAQGANQMLREDLAATELELHKAASELRRSNTRLAQLDAVTDAAAAGLPAGQKLLVRTEGDAGIVHVLGRRTTIGRISANDLCIDTDFISRHHAVVLVTDTETVVEDLNSTNGVFVNNVRVTRHELREGDLLTIGKTSFRYVFKREVQPV